MELHREWSAPAACAAGLFVVHLHVKQIFAKVQLFLWHVEHTYFFTDFFLHAEESLAISKLFFSKLWYFTPLSLHVHHILVILQTIISHLEQNFGISHKFVSLVDKIVAILQLFHILWRADLSFFTDIYVAFRADLGYFTDFSLIFKGGTCYLTIIIFFSFLFYM